MAQITTNAHAAPILHTVLHALGAPFRAYWRFCEKVMENDGRMKRVKALNAKSDEELAEIGLRREDIVPFVFGAHFYA